MTDLWLHFGACFGIAVMTYCVIMVYRIKQMNNSLEESNGLENAMQKWLDEKAAEAVFIAFVVSLIAGIGKEVWDIFYSDPQWKDLVADMFGTTVALIVLANTEIKYTGGGNN